MSFLKSAVGRKIVMSVTGLVLVLFVLAHLVGNSSVFIGPDGINAYAAKLHGLGPVVWGFRLVMLFAVLLHVYYGIQVTLENNAAKPSSYAVRRNLRATFASRNMIWSGLFMAAFLIYHLLHFTLQVTHPGIAAGRNLDVMGRPDVFMMVVLSFQDLFISLLYVFAMVAVALHLTHGIQSLFQTLGLNSERTFPFIVKTGVAAAILFSLGYIAIPVFIAAGIVRP